MECLSLNGISVLHPFFSWFMESWQRKGQRHFKSQEPWVWIQENGVLWTQCRNEHRDCDSMHEPHASSSQTKSHGEGRERRKLTLVKEPFAIDGCWERENQFSSRVLSSVSQTCPNGNLYVQGYTPAQTRNDGWRKRKKRERERIQSWVDMVGWIWEELGEGADYD